MREIPRPLRACIYGLGAIGAAVAKELLRAPGVEITGAIDIDPKKVGRDLHALLRMKARKGPSVKVSADAAGTLKACAPHVVVHCTGSRLIDVAPSLQTIIEAGVSCVSSCEEMALPDVSDPGIAADLDRRARARGVTLLGTGVNPGFAMDVLVLTLSGATRNVQSITVERVLDPLSRRRAFRKKVGLGLTYRQASRKVEAGRMGHVGLRHSAMLVARGLSWAVTSVEEDIRILCDGQSAPKRSKRPPRPDSPVVGLHQTLVARAGATGSIRMEMVMAAGVEAPHDAITIAGEPDLSLWIQGGIPGDSATVACLVNAMGQMIDPPRAGLLTVLDLPLRPAWRAVQPS